MDLLLFVLITCAVCAIIGFIHFEIQDIRDNLLDLDRDVKQIKKYFRRKK